MAITHDARALSTLEPSSSWLQKILGALIAARTKQAERRVGAYLRGTSDDVLERRGLSKVAIARLREPPA